MAEEPTGSDRTEHSLARSVLARVQRTRGALSPWARDWLPASLSAPSQLGDWRSRTAPRAAGHTISPRERVSRREAAEEWIFLGLRRTEGVPWDLLAAAAGGGAAALDRRVAFLAQQGLLERRDGWLRLARAGRFVSDAIFADLMAAMEEPAPVSGGRR